MVATLDVIVQAAHVVAKPFREKERKMIRRPVSISVVSATNSWKA